MISKTFPDGTVEIAQSGSVEPPGFKGQAGNVSSIWFRINGGEWESPYCRTMHKLIECLECADSAKEFRIYVGLANFTKGDS